VDEDGVRAFLTQRFGQSARVEVMRPGEWSSAYSVVVDGDEMVVRFSAYDEDFEKDAYASRWSSPVLPIAPIREWGPAGDGFYAVAPRMSGEHLEELDSAGMRRVMPSLFAALDAMRAVDLSAVTGFGGWRSDGRTRHRTWHDDILGVARDPATRGSPGWRELLKTSPIAMAAFEEGYARMLQLLDFCPEARHLIHDDLVNFNVLVQADRISAVLDWGSSKYGDFVYDLAKLVFYEPWYPQWQTIDFAAEMQAHYDAIGLVVPHFAERLRCYCLHEGIGGLAYSAFRNRWEQVARKADRVLEFARS
jgi:hygromycin-B 4-O-kinase